MQVVVSCRPANRHLAQWLERTSDTRVVLGSIPRLTTRRVANRLRHHSYKVRYAGSNPVAAMWMGALACSTVS
jgi:hypothetical protein